MTDKFRYHILPDKIYLVDIDGTTFELLGSAILDYIKDNHEPSRQEGDQA